MGTTVTNTPDDEHANFKTTTTHDTRTQGHTRSGPRDTG